MEKLLNWSLANQGDNPDARARAGAPDQEALAKLFGFAGKDDPTQMKEDGELLLNPDSTDDQKLNALENMESLIENLDNANNLKNMKLWPAINSQLDSSNDEILAAACSTIGSAVQNNPPSQEAFLESCSDAKTFQRLVQLAKSSKSAAVQNKALYALSNVCRHSVDAYALFDSQGGWEILPEVLNDPKSSPKLLNRSLSLLNSLVSTEVEHSSFSSPQGKAKLAKIEKNGVVGAILDRLAKDNDKDSSNVDFVDRSLALLVTLASGGYVFSSTEKDTLKTVLASLEKNEDVNQDDCKALEKCL